MPNTAESTAVCVICGKEFPPRPDGEVLRPAHLPRLPGCGDLSLCLLRPPYPVERTGRLQRGRDLPGLL